MEVKRPYFVDQWLLRIRRLVRHLVFPFSKSNPNDFPPSGMVEWMTDLGFYWMDVIALPEMYQVIMWLVKWQMRKLTTEELQLAYQVFGENIKYDRITVDDKAKLGTKKLAIAYVSFNTINFDRKLSKHVFIHELVHVWQYQHFGSIYIARAIKAQRSKEGYNYGGPARLYHHMLKGGKLTDFNFEQQADIIEDYYKMITRPDHAGPMNLSIYHYYADQLERG